MNEALIHYQFRYITVFKKDEISEKILRSTTDRYNLIAAQ